MMRRAPDRRRIEQALQRLLAAAETVAAWPDPSTRNQMGGLTYELGIAISHLATALAEADGGDSDEQAGAQVIGAMR